MKKINYIIFTIIGLFVIYLAFAGGMEYSRVIINNSCNVCNVNCIQNLRENNITNFFTSYYPGMSDNEACYVNLNQEEINACCKC